MASARPPKGVDGGAAGRAAVVPVRFSMAPAWDDLREHLLVALTDRAADGTQPEPPRPGGSPFPGADADRVEALVELAQNGDAEAFGQLYERSVEQVYRYVYLRTGDRHLSEDITSETFLKAMRNIGTFTWQGRDIAAWFITIARNLVIDHRKSARFRLEITTDELLHRPAGEDGPEDVVLRRQRDGELVDALRGLTSDQAECIVLRFMEGLSLAECAIVLGRKQNAVKQLQLRAIRALRKDLDRAG